MRSEIFKALTDGGVLLTASSRLAADWKRRYAEAQPAEACETPAIYPWHGWLQELTARISPDIALNPLQEQLLWEQVIRNDPLLPEEISEPSLRGLARHAVRACALMCEYGIHSDELVVGGEESEALARWIDGVQAELKRNSLKGRALAAGMSKILIRKAGGMKLPQQIMLDGFDCLTPVQQQILEAVKAAGCRISEAGSSAAQAAPVLTACADELDECRHIAIRLRSLLDSNPQARIAIVSCKASPDVRRLNRALNAALMPDEALNPASRQPAIAVPGQSLSDMPMIRQLIHMLGMAGRSRISFVDFSPLLFCPWLRGYEAERFGRARLDALFRSWNRHRLTWTALLKTKEIQRLPQFHAVVKALAGWRHGHKSAAVWVQGVLDLLQETGFVQAGRDGRQARSNADIRQMNAFRDVLATMVAADAVSARMDWGRFFSMLRSACADAQASLTPRYPNVVMMPLPAIAGLHFDHVLVMGMDEEAFPPPARPHSLLPLYLQRKYAIPMSTAPLAYERSRWLWNQLLLAAPGIEISYARQKDERELLPSSFVTSLMETPCISPGSARRVVEWEKFTDAPKVPLRGDEAIRGGAAIIRNQSACPFRAFAMHRLGIAELGETTPGIDPATKGSLIHHALEFIWKRLKTRQALLEKGEAGRARMIEAAIAHAWEENRSYPDSDIQAVEKKRMRDVLVEWLALEAERPSFEVLKTEEKYDLLLPFDGKQQFPIRVKTDRLDTDAEGHHILLDYKTGARQPASGWQGARMEEPQLPLYALAVEKAALAGGVNRIDAVAFAYARSGDMGFEGMAADDVGIKKIRPYKSENNEAPQDWRALVMDWEQSINTLAQEFVNGRCDVSPRDADACRYCTLKAVCRVEETGFDTGAGGKA